MNETPTEAGAGVPYHLIFSALVVFTAIEVAVSYLPEGIKLPILLTLALAKAALVALFFMHLKYDSRLYAFLLVLGAFIVVPLVLIMMIVMPHF
jgi:cytochrome c oxidase subunit 4